MRTPTLALLVAAASLVGGCAAELRAADAGRLFSQGCYQLSGAHLDAAERAYRESLELHPSSAAANNLGVIQARREDLDGARAWFARATEIDEHDVIARTNLGVVLFHLGDTGRAAETLLSARRARRETIDQLPSSGRIAWDADRYAAATESADAIAARYLDRLLTSTAATRPDDGLRIARNLVVAPIL